MNIIDLRTNLRRAAEDRRKIERRKNPHPFGSAEWLAYLSENDIEAPTEDGRDSERRAIKNRKESDQRSSSDDISEERIKFEKKYERIFLTPAERKLLEDMYLTDLD
ncbi:hypothetical protein JCM14076_07880 [Methylosoma difficile]